LEQIQKRRAYQEEFTKRIFANISIFFLLTSLCGCAPGATRVDPLASLNIETTPRLSEFYSYKELSLALILSENIKNTGEQLQKWNRMMILNPGEQVDIDKFFNGVASIFKKNFRNVTIIKNIEQARKFNVDIIAILDINMELSNWVFNPNKTEISSILLTNGKAEIDTVRAEGVAKGHGSLALTITDAKINFENALLASKKLQAFSKAKSPSLPDVADNFERANKPGSLESAAPTPVISSDVDELPLIKVKPNKNAYAIVIGVENYRQKLPKADYAASDAQTVTNYLTRVMGYPEENVVTLLNDHASNVDLAKYFEKWLPNNVETGGSVFIFYSGHGAPNTKTGDAYLVPYDGDPSFIEQTGYSLKRMYDALAKLPAKEIVVALDSCFSGAGGRSVLAEGARPLVMNLQKSVVLSKNMTVLAAASGDQISSTYKEKGHGLFTYFMLKGIKNEDVVKPDGSIKMDDLFSYIKPQVERIARKQYNNEQTPQLIGAKKN